jgi:REP-associated tyrosine transposase
MRHYQRRLPHWDTVDQPLFVTFRLHGSLPAHRVFPPESLARSGKAFVAMGSLLDSGASGPLYLRRPELAEMVVGALHDGERRFHRYQLHAYVVMPNHVHLLVTPNVVATRWLAPLKGFTAYRANELLGAHGQAFWQDESYDHMVRSETQFESIRSYIEENPVKAGLVCKAHKHPWSSAASRLKGGCGQDWPPHALTE